MKRKKISPQKPKWQRAQQKKRRIKLKEIFIRLTTMVVFFLFIGLLFFLWQSLRNALWDGKHQFNFVVQTNKVMIFSYHPQEKILNILTFPDKTYVPVAYNLGNYPLLNIYQLGELEKIGGGKLLSLSLRNFLAVPIDGYFVLAKEQALKWQKGDKNIERGKLGGLLLFLIKRKAQTNFTLWDIIRIFTSFHSLKQEQIKVFDFSDPVFIKQETLADGSKVLTPNFLRIDQLSGQIFADKTILDEGLTISVLNGSGKLGLAKLVGRLAKNLGLELISTSDTQATDESVIFWRAPKIKKSYTMSRLISSLSINKTRRSQKGEDIVVVIGKDLMKSF